MKIVYFGSDVFLSCFEYFLREHTVIALYTYHNPEDYFTEFSIVQQAQTLHIPVHYESITPEEITRFFQEEGCELFFLAEYDRILTLPKDFPAFRGINVHSSLLPQGRSYYPIEAAMERDLCCTGVTLHKVAQCLDHGDILAQHTVELTPETDSIDVYLYCASYALEMTEAVMADLDGYWNRAIPQKEKQPYWKRPDAALMTLTHEMTCKEALEIFRKYNRMTQVEENGNCVYVTGMSTGKGPLDTDSRLIAPFLLLYRVKDGHLRLHIYSESSM